MTLIEHAQIGVSFATYLRCLKGLGRSSIASFALRTFSPPRLSRAHLWPCLPIAYLSLSFEAIKPCAGSE